jgi:regulator of RNase E activity RraA
MDHDDLLRRLSRIDSTAISDALDQLGLPSGTGELRAQGVPARVSGTVSTVALEPTVDGDLGPHIASDAIADAEPGDVLVIANDGRVDVSCWGGLLSLGSVRQRVAGVIADGACRDITAARSYGLPVFARAVTPRTARGRLRQKSTGAPVCVAGITVCHGDLVVADDSGVAFVPRQHASDVVTRAEEIIARESAIAADIRAGVPINQAMLDARLAGHDDGGERAIPSTERMAALPTAAISDALDKLTLRGALLGIAPLFPGQKACGRAYTVGYTSVDDSRGTVGDFLDDVPADAVIVIDNHGRTDCTVWGGIMTQVAAARGIAATVVHGVCRDVEEASQRGYPVWSAGRFMRTGKDRVRLAFVQRPVTIDGVPVRPDDLVCCDADGVVVVPADRAAEVAEMAGRIQETELAIMSAVASGSSLTRARAGFGYHALQTAVSPNEGGHA